METIMYGPGNLGETPQKTASSCFSAIMCLLFKLIGTSGCGFRVDWYRSHDACCSATALEADGM